MTRVGGLQCYAQDALEEWVVAIVARFGTLKIVLQFLQSDGSGESPAYSDAPLPPALRHATRRALPHVPSALILDARMRALGETGDMLARELRASMSRSEDHEK